MSAARRPDGWFQRICCFLTVRLLMTWLTADSVDAVQMASLTLSRSPFRRSGTGRHRGARRA